METCEVGGCRLAHVRRGDRGPVLLLVHGFPLDHSMWRFQIEQFADRCRVVAVDLRGFGASRSNDEIVTMDQLADDCARLLDRIGIDEPVTWCGLSMGGYVGWQFWRRHRARLERLVMCDTRAKGDTDEVARGRRRMAYDVIASGPRPVADSMLPRLFAPETFRRYPERVAEIEQVILRTEPRAIAAAQRGMAVRLDVTSWLGSIDLPALLVCGADDEISRPEEMEGMAAAMPAARFVCLPDAGHMAPLENPEAFGRSLDAFLFSA
ncbi:MAG TPA: alpha/beta fold hydrolase [Pirellulaceae bacterium]|nr:alpha/beta fold hydrolase [Pirellulaceae bacterium]